MRNGPIALIGDEHGLDALMAVSAIQAVITHGDDGAIIPCCFQTALQWFLRKNDNSSNYNNIKTALQQADGYIRSKTTFDYVKQNYNVFSHFISKLLKEPKHSDFTTNSSYTASNIYSRLTTYGEGWVADEALAIAIYSLMQADSVDQLLQISANHSGDSDSTACIAMQIYGSFAGFKGVNLSMLGVDVLDEIAFVVFEDMARE